jgi:hypothetical protein
MKAPAIFWTKDEWAALFVEYKANTHRMGRSKGLLSQHAMLHELQTKVLPPERRRNFLVQPSGGVAASNTCKKLNSMLAEEQAATPEKNKETSTETVTVVTNEVVSYDPPPPSLVATPTAVPAQVDQEIANQAAVKQEPPPVFEQTVEPPPPVKEEEPTYTVDAFTPAPIEDEFDFSSVINREIHNRVQKAIQEHTVEFRVELYLFKERIEYQRRILERIFAFMDHRKPGSANALREDLKAGPPPMEKKARILVMGIFPAQQQEFLSRVGRWVEPTLITIRDKDLRAEWLQNRTYVDAAYVMTKVAGHQQTDMMKRIFGERCIYIHGGFSDLVRNVLNRYVPLNKGI